MPLTIPDAMRSALDRGLYQSTLKMPIICFDLGALAVLLAPFGCELGHCLGFLKP